MIKYQAIILAGGANSGSQLYPLCITQPKVLLPVANKPMILYQLEMLEQFGITDIIIVTTQENHKLLAQTQGKFKNKCEIAVVPDNTESGTAILHIADRIKKDFIIMSCDTICDVNLLDVIDYHTTNQSLITMICKQENLDNKMGKAPISCNLDDTYDIMAIAEGGQLVQIANSNEVSEVLALRKHSLMKYDEVRIMSNLFDSHIYVCKQQLITVMAQTQQIYESLQAQENQSIQQLENFKDDFLPFLVKNQCCRQLISMVQKQKKQDFFAARKEKQFNIGVFVTQNYVRRVNNMKDYQQANYDALIKGEKSIKVFAHIQSAEPPQYQGQVKVSPDSLIGEDVQIGDKTIIQRSIIGRHCKIENNVKIINSIIQQHCVIHQGCSIQNSILGHQTNIEQNCIIDRCQTGPQTQIQSGSKLVDEAIVQ